MAAPSTGPHLAVQTQNFALSRRSTTRSAALSRSIRAVNLADGGRGRQYLFPCNDCRGRRHTPTCPNPRRRMASSTSRATGQYLAGTRFGHSENVFKINELIQFGLLLG